MKNDKERKAFIDEEANWKIVDQMFFGIYPMVTIKQLEYCGRKWFKVTTRTVDEKVDWDSATATVTTTDYANNDGHPDYFKVSEDHNAFRDISKTDILNSIKAIDRMGK